MVILVDDDHIHYSNTLQMRFLELSRYEERLKSHKKALHKFEIPLFIFDLNTSVLCEIFGLLVAFFYIPQFSTFEMVLVGVERANDN